MSVQRSVQVEQSWVDELQKRASIQEANRRRMAEIRAARGDAENSLRSLDSALKKTTAFMKKVKALNAAAVGGLVAELDRLNLSKFVEEMASGIAETKLKLADVAPVAELCVAIAARYPTFSELLLEQLKKSLPLKKTDKVGNVAKLRVDIIFLAELLQSGVLPEKEGLQALGNVLSFLVLTDQSEHTNVGLLATVCRFVGWQIAEIVPHPSPTTNSPTTFISTGDLPMPTTPSAAQRKTIRELLFNYHAGLMKRAEAACAKQNVALKKVKRQERTRGDAGEDEKLALNTAKAELDHIRALGVELSAALGIEMKELREEQSEDEEDEIAAEEMRRALAGGHLSLWPDEEIRVFYERLIDIRSMVPKALYKDSEQRTVEKGKMQSNIDEVDVDNINEAGDTDADSTAAYKNASPNPPSRESTPTLPDLLQTVEPGGTEDNRQRWQNFLLDLDHLVSKDLTDKAALYFVSNLNSKGNRKKLVKLLVNPPAARMDLTPFYARLIATLEPVMPDVTSEIVNHLIARFRDFIQRGGDERVENKMSCVMLIAELMKFEVIPRAEGLSCLRQLVYDLRGHAVEMAATMLESGGMYLYRSADSHPKMKRLLEVLQAKRERMKDLRQAMLVENAYFCCVPPESGDDVRRIGNQEPLIRTFIRHLVVDMKDSTVDIYLRCLRRIDWCDSELADFAIRQLASPWLMPLENLCHLASGVAGLAALPNFGWVGVAVIDAVVETIRLSLEVPGLFNQWAQATIVYLGELYNYNLVSNELLFSVLYQLISFPEQDALAWQDLYRLRMVCALVTIVGEFFQKGGPRQKMLYFLAYFYRYYYQKKEAWTQAMLRSLAASTDADDVAAEADDVSVQAKFPFEVETAFAEVQKLFHDAKRSTKVAQPPPKNLADAEENVANIEKSLKEKVDAVLQGVMDANTVDDDDDDARRQPSSARSRAGLNSIVEEDDNTDEPRASDRDDVIFDVDDDEEKIRIHIEKEKQASAQEEEEFQRELDRMFAENMRLPVLTANAATSSNAFDVTVPAAARTRFQRQLKFADGTKNGGVWLPTSITSLTKAITTDAGRLKDKPKDSDVDNDDDDGDSDSATSAPTKVCLMARGKNNKAQLKTVSIDDAVLHESWREQREREQRERDDIKRVTLVHSRRIEAEEEKELHDEIRNTTRFRKK